MGEKWFLKNIVNFVCNVARFLLVCFFSFRSTCSKEGFYEIVLLCQGEYCNQIHKTNVLTGFNVTKSWLNECKLCSYWKCSVMICGNCWENIWSKYLLIGEITDQSLGVFVKKNNGDVSCSGQILTCDFFDQHVFECRTRAYKYVLKLGLVNLQSQYFVNAFG